MGEQLSEADIALLKSFGVPDPASVSEFRMMRETMAAIIQAARSEGPHPESGEDECPNPKGCAYCHEFGCPRASPPPLEGAGREEDGSSPEKRASERLNNFVSGALNAACVERAEEQKGPSGQTWLERYQDLLRKGQYGPALAMLRQPAEPISSSKGEALPVVSEEMVEAAAHGWLSSAYNATIADNARGEKTLVWRNTIRDARAALTAALSLPRPSPGVSLPDDVVRLVIAARGVAFDGCSPDADDDERAALQELDDASEAFASRVPWEDEPVSQREGE